MTRPHILKRLLSKITRIGVDVSEEETAQANEAELPNSPPPPYAESSSQGCTDHFFQSYNNPYPILSKYVESCSRHGCAKLYWVLVEILAVTFRLNHAKTELSRLRRAFANTDPAWVHNLVDDKDESSTRNEAGKEMTIEVCILVRNLQSIMARNRWLLVHPRDKLLVEKMVLEPIRDLELNLDFVLELLGRYNRYYGYGSRRPESTLLDFWTTSPRATDLADVIASHALLLQDLVLVKEMRQVLKEYIAEFQKKNGLEELCTSSELQEESLRSGATCCWPLSDGYMDLARGLRTLGTSFIHDLYEQSRTRLRRKRNLRIPRENEDLQSSVCISLVSFGV
ncbi:hypothetical protein PMIN01_01384 [Paraphaeosphaeria minitans]|uniref:Uncharacterized protein n=1 Tax=Paraphaeosphaeria minitans TaxID=565426 RepID=A0A9P6GWK7_9PLEO|nr:hypothetical protein PMIN01_01384 [Paraphaeosphaeria minitans]